MEMSVVNKTAVTSDAIMQSPYLLNEILNNIFKTSTVIGWNSCFNIPNSKENLLLD